MNKIFCIIYFLLFQQFLYSQPDYNSIVSEFDSLIVIQNSNSENLKSILNSQKNDTTFIFDNQILSGLLNMMNTEGNNLNTVIEKANNLVFLNTAKHKVHRSNLFLLTDSSKTIYNNNIAILFEIYAAYLKKTGDEKLLGEFEKLKKYKIHYFKPQYVK